MARELVARGQQHGDEQRKTAHHHQHLEPEREAAGMLVDRETKKADHKEERREEELDGAVTSFGPGRAARRAPAAQGRDQQSWTDDGEEEAKAYFDGARRRARDDALGDAGEPREHEDAADT